MNKRQAQRFADHIEFLRGVPKEGFEMDRFFSKMDPPWNTSRSTTEPPKKQDASCGTAACVAGWLPVNFPRSWSHWGKFPCLKETRALGMVKVMDQFAKFFGIGSDDADLICDPYFYSGFITRNITKGEVINRMILIGKKYGWDCHTPKIKQVKVKK